MRSDRTPYQCGFHAGRIGQDYIKGDAFYKSADYIAWWKGWQKGKAARPQLSTKSPRRPQPRRPQPQRIRRRHYLKAVERLGKVPF